MEEKSWLAKIMGNQAI